ncbi:MAG: hypothetical protein IPM57_04810 [Oligoflexia bacterium]|nr:hypothetical protein [Oligoflexia bacterium]
MKKAAIVATIITLCINSSAFALTSSMSEYFLKDNILDLPLEIEEGPAGDWNQLWLKQHDKADQDPYALIVRGLGVRWYGTKDQAVLVFADKNVVNVQQQRTLFGKLDSKKENILWEDGSKQQLIDYKKRRKKRTRSKKVNFGKVSLPPVKEKMPIIEHTNSLKIKYAKNCSATEKASLEEIFQKEIEPQLTCWGNQNPKKALQLMVALLQTPTLECSNKTNVEYCGKATLPLLNGFFVTEPEIEIVFNKKCSTGLKDTILHESLHLAGITHGPQMEEAIKQAKSCKDKPGVLSFSNEAEEFYNDLQGETAMVLFRTIKDAEEAKTNLTEAERAYILGHLCTKMGDKFCARRYFQIATEEGRGSNITLPSGQEVTFKAAAHFALFDSVVESRSRMHELAKYLRYDPKGVLISKIETPTHLTHEYYVARAALEIVKDNKGVCNDDTDDKVSCEDLGVIVKTPWFKGN